MCSNFRQINDNVVTVKIDVACTTTVSDMQKRFKYSSRFEIGSNSSEPLVDERIIPTDQVVNANSYETSNLDIMTNKVPPMDSNDANENKEHEKIYPLSFKLKKNMFQ